MYNKQNEVIIESVYLPLKLDLENTPTIGNYGYIGHGNVYSKYALTEATFLPETQIIKFNINNDII